MANEVSTVEGFLRIALDKKRGGVAPCEPACRDIQLQEPINLVSGAGKTDVTSQIALPGVLLMVVTIVLALQIEVCNVRRQVSQRASAGVLPASRTQQRMQTFEHPLTALQQSIFAES